MTTDIRPRVRLPRSITAGEAFEIKTLVTHPMETGHRRDTEGAIVPRHVVERFTCEFDGELVMEMNISGGIGANPYFEFWATVPGSGTMTFTWYDDTGEVWTETKDITVG